MREPHSRLSMLKLATLPLVGLVLAVGLAAWLLWSPLGGSSTAQATGAHITVTKECSLSAGVFTFKFTITNDGDIPLIRWIAKDSTLGNMVWEFPETLAVGQTETVTFTKPQLPWDNLCNWAEVAYRNPENYLEIAKVRPRCCVTPPEVGSVTLPKYKQVGEFTKPTLVCFRLDLKTNGYVPSPDPPEGAEQCKAPDATGNVTFTWTNLPPGEYRIVETKEVCEVKGVVQDPCTVYAPLPPIPFTMPDPPQAIVLPEAENTFEAGLCFTKRNPDGTLWSGEDVEFTVTSLTDPSLPPQTHLLPRDIPAGEDKVCKLVPEGKYEICERPPPNCTVQPSVCQTVEVLSGAAPFVIVTFINTCEGEGCTPGFWKQKHHLPRWAEAGVDPSTDFDAFFGVDSFDPDKTLFQVVNIKGKKGDALLILVPHLIAAVLNANHPDVGYAFTEAEIIAMFQAAFSDDAAMHELKNKLAAENEAGCPLN